jgi:hypothetical protein
MRTLRQLFLMHTPISDGCLESLVNLPELVDLNIAGTQVADDGIASLSKIIELQSVSIQGSKITPAGAEKLVRLGTFKVYLDQSQVTPAMQEDKRGGRLEFELVPFRRPPES